MTNYHQQQHQHQQQQQQQRHHQTAVHASQSHQTLALRDDGSSALSGLVSALLGGRPSGNRTHEVIVHSPVSVLNGGNSMAKAASMSELVKETSSNPDILS
jgi:transcription initiation factor TFIID subunit TAF12